MILLSLLGEQPIPNLLPLWQKNSPFLAVRFVVSDATLPIAGTLIQLLKTDPQLKHLDVLPPIHVEPYDYLKTTERLSDSLSQYHYNNQPVIMNLTGGTKLMSLAAMQSARQHHIPVLYIATECAQIITLDPQDGKEISREKIEVKISVEQYLAAHGVEISAHQNFNRKSQLPYRPPKEGDALESKVYQLASQSGIFDDVQRGIFVRRIDRPEVQNELDILVTRNGRLVVCSCKSGQNFMKDWIYEISSLSSRESFGIYCGKVLVVDQEEISETHLSRARINHVKIVYGKKIDEIDQVLKQTLAGR
jgi:hypothetical protein